MSRASQAEEIVRRLRELGGGPWKPAGPSRAGPEWAAAIEQLEVLLAEVRAAEERLETRQAELDRSGDALRASRMRYQELFDFAPDGYLTTDAQGVIEEANHAAAALFRTRREFVVGKPLPFFLSHESREEFYQTLVALRTGKTGTVREWEVVARPPRTSPVHLALTVSLTPGAGGEPAGFRWLLRDLTPWMRTEHALRAEKWFADSLLDTAQTIVLVLDASGRVIRSNRYLRTVSGYTEEDLLGQDGCETFLSERDRGPARELLRQALTYGVTRAATGSLIARDGQPRAVAWSIKALPAEGGEPPALLVVGHDITDLQEAQRQAVQGERLAAIGQMIAGLAHESRNALQRTQACLERLTWRLQDSPEALDLAQRARAAQADLARLFEEVRTYATPLRAERERCHLVGVWREAWSQARGEQPEKEALLSEDGCADDLWCSGDRFHLGQVFRNILENALYAGPTPVRVTVHCREVNLNGRRAVRLAFRDNGPGLTAEQRERIFEPFFTTKARGSGLGMAIARRIVEAHGGTIAAHNAARGGAEIVVTLPRDSS